MTTMFILVKGCIWVQGFYKLEALGVLMGSLVLLFSRLWLTYGVLVFVCLMLLLSYMLLFKKCLKNISLESEYGF